MITVDLFKNEQGLITGYKVSGHAGFAAAGEDIVCGAVSDFDADTNPWIGTAFEMSAVISRR